MGGHGHKAAMCLGSQGETAGASEDDTHRIPSNNLWAYVLGQGPSSRQGEEDAPRRSLFSGSSQTIGLCSVWFGHQDRGHIGRHCKGPRSELCSGC